MKILVFYWKLSPNLIKIYFWHDNLSFLMKISYFGNFSIRALADWYCYRGTLLLSAVLDRRWCSFRTVKWWRGTEIFVCGRTNFAGKNNSLCNVRMIPVNHESDWMHLMFDRIIVLKKCRKWETKILDALIGSFQRPVLAKFQNKRNKERNALA